MLLRSTCAELPGLHDLNGKHVQLLGLYVHPDVQGQGLGDELIEFMLVYCGACEGVESVVGVTRCLNYWRHRGRKSNFKEYVGWRDDQGRLVDPMLHFHESHGALVRDVLPSFRPEDTQNEGAGVLIEYLIRHRPPTSESKSAPSVPAGARDISEMVRESVLRVLGPERSNAYGPDVPLMAMGLGSLDLLELRHVLGERAGQELEPTFFFRCGTPTAVIAHLSGEADSRPNVRSASSPHRPRRHVAGVEAGSVPSASASHPDEAIAVVGLGCHFPGGARGPGEFWALLHAGRDAIVELPQTRRQVFGLAGGTAVDPERPVMGGFINDIDQWDAGFFRVSPREASLLDPQQRLLLEIVWESLEQAGFAPLGLRGSVTGVFVGTMGHDYEGLIAKRGSEKDFDAYFSTGNAASVAAGRLAYFFDWRGPTLTVDTACSSSLVAVHLACQSLKSGECNLAVAAGVNVLLDSKSFVAFGRAGMLAPDGRCKTFDAAANGYVRGEGCGVVVLKRLADAQRDGDRILAVIRGSAINQDGASSGLTVPNQISQQEVIEKALANAQVAPYEVVYLEAHGTGTSLGDPIEVQAAAAALGAGRAVDRPLLIGSVKTNLGHLEAAAGMAGLIKVILAMEHGVIPRQLHFREGNPHIPWGRLPVKVTTEASAWPAGRKIAGVSSFGFSGTNAHVVVEAGPALAETPPGEAGAQERSAHVLVLSARSEAALGQLAGRYGEWLHGHPEAALADVCYGTGMGRSHLAQRRAALVASTVSEARELLGKLAGGESAAGLFQESSQAKPKVAWLFSGEGSQYVEMGRELYASQPVVRAVLDRCARALAGQRERGLLEVLFEHEELLDQAAYTQPALFALEVAMAELLLSWGQVPDVVVGHSAGEYAAAVI
ncbi:MAG: GNAT family N-acetyltransferase, partial [Limisphaerales bacterium]